MSIGVTVSMWKPVYRFFERTLRIAIGAGVAYFTFQIVVWAIQTLNKPFASLSPLQLIGSIVGIGIGLLAAAFAYYAAFGKDYWWEERVFMDVAGKQKEIRKGMGYDE